MKNSNPKSITIITYNIPFLTYFLVLALFILKSLIDGLYSSNFSLSASNSIFVFSLSSVIFSINSFTSFSSFSLLSLVETSKKSSISSISLDTFLSISKSSISTVSSKEGLLSSKSRVSISSSFFFITILLYLYHNFIINMYKVQDYY